MTTAHPSPLSSIIMGEKHRIPTCALSNPPAFFIYQFRHPTRILALKTKTRTSQKVRLTIFHWTHHPRSWSQKKSTILLQSSSPIIRNLSLLALCHCTIFLFHISMLPTLEFICKICNTGWSGFPKTRISIINPPIFLISLWTTFQPSLYKICSNGIQQGNSRNPLKLAQVSYLKSVPMEFGKQQGSIFTTWILFNGFYRPSLFHQ